MDNLRILIADDSSIVRNTLTGLIQLLSKNWLVCGTAVDGAEAIRRTQELKPDVILLDISLPLQNGLDVAKILRETCPSVKILIMSEHDEDTLSRISKEYGFECLPKLRLATDIGPALQRLSAR